MPAKTTKTKRAPRKAAQANGKGAQGAPKAKSKGKTPAGKSNGSRKRPAALSEERTHKLRKDQLAKFRQLEAEVRAAKAELEVTQMRLDAILRDVPPVRNALIKRQAAETAFAKILGEYRAYMKNLGDRLGLDMATVAIDDATGLVREIPVRVGDKGS